MQSETLARTLQDFISDSRNAVVIEDGAVTVRARFEQSIARIRKICRDVEIGAISTAEVAFRYRGLEFARARLTTEPGTFSNVQEIVFGVGPQEAPLTNQNAPEFVNFLRVLIESRQSQGPRHQTLWRVHPERWLEALVLEDVTAIDGNLDPTQVYSQVPAFAAADRAMVDVLGVTRAGQLAVIELKAEEDIHLPLQGLDYWAREVASGTKRISEIRILSRSPVFGRSPLADAGGASAAHSSCDRYPAALFVTRDSLDLGRD